MICTVYWGNAGLVLVPDCMTATREAEASHGPLRACGSFDTESLPPELAERVGAEMDSQSYAPLSADLAMRLGYVATEQLPLPEGFHWREADWWESGGQLNLACGDGAGVVVAFVGPVGFGWEIITNCHRPWPFRGIRLSPTRMAAIQFATMWAALHARELRGETSVAVH